MTCTLVVTATLAVATLASPLTADAARARIATRYYPAGAHIAYFPSVSNRKLDCSWGFFCEGGVPLFHFETQDQLHRLGGWAQYAGWRHGHSTMGFALYASRYQTGLDPDGSPWSRAAFEDLLRATRAQGYLQLRHIRNVVPPRETGEAIDAIQRSGPQDSVVMACWSGSTEVEAMVVFDHRPAAVREAATRYLREQVQTAMQAS